MNLAGFRGQNKHRKVKLHSWAVHVICMESFQDVFTKIQLKNTKYKDVWRNLCFLTPQATD